MTLNQNQFAMTTIQGQLDLSSKGGLVLSVQVGSGQATALVPGQAVKLVDSAGGVPKVVSLAADTDPSFGFVVFNMKDISYAAGAALEIAMQGAIQFMTAGAAIARGAKLEVVNATKKVITNAGTNPVVGYALDKAAADGDLIRVYILTQSYESSQTIADVAGLQAALDVLTANDVNSLQTFKVTATLAEINAGKEIVPAVTGKKIRVVNYAARVVGTAAANTSVDLQSGTSATKVTALGVAGLSNGAILQPTSANTTLGAGFAADLETSENLKVVNVGSTMTTLTSVTFTVTAQYV